MNASLENRKLNWSVGIEPLTFFWWGDADAATHPKTIPVLLFSGFPEAAAFYGRRKNFAKKCPKRHREVKFGAMTSAQAGLFKKSRIMSFLCCSAGLPLASIDGFDQHFQATVHFPLTGAIE